MPERIRLTVERTKRKLVVNWSKYGVTMTEVGAYEAKTRLAELLERVRQGERFVITKHGRPVAELVPTSAVDAHAVQAALAEVVRARAWLLRRGITLRAALDADQGARDLAHDGHRY